MYLNVFVFRILCSSSSLSCNVPLKSCSKLARGQAKFQSPKEPQRANKSIDIIRDANRQTASHSWRMTAFVELTTTLAERGWTYTHDFQPTSDVMAPSSDRTTFDTSIQGPAESTSTASVLSDSLEVSDWPCDGETPLFTSTAGESEISGAELPSPLAILSAGRIVGWGSVEGVLVAPLPLLSLVACSCQAGMPGARFMM